MEYKVVEVYKTGEKVFKGKAHRQGWMVYEIDKKGNATLKNFLKEDKLKR